MSDILNDSGPRDLLFSNALQLGKILPIWPELKSLARVEAVQKVLSTVIAASRDRK